MLLCSVPRLRHVRGPSSLPVASSFRSKIKPHAFDFAKHRRPHGAGVGVARKPGHTRDCRTGVHRHRRAAGGRTAQAIRHRSDFRSAVPVFPAGRSECVAELLAPARPCSRRHRMDHGWGAFTGGRAGRRIPPPGAIAGSLSRIDVAGCRIPDDGLAGARRRNGS